MLVEKISRAGANDESCTPVSSIPMDIIKMIPESLKLGDSNLPQNHLN